MLYGVIFVGWARPGRRRGRPTPLLLLMLYVHAQVAAGSARFVHSIKLAEILKRSWLTYLLGNCNFSFLVSFFFATAIRSGDPETSQDLNGGHKARRIAQEGARG